MDDIHRRDRQVFLRELARFVPMAVCLAYLIGIAIEPNPAWIVLGGLVVAWTVVAAHRRSVRKRFYNNKFLLLWDACTDRLKRFHEAMAEAKKRGVPELQDLPRSVDSVAGTLYTALRRADIVQREVLTSEGWLIAAQRNSGPISPDQKAQELYRLADKNIAEYRHHYKLVMSGVERTEAQAAVFTTTLDTMRLRMLGHRLVGKSPELAHTEFLQAMTEARMQLDSIDKALDELELTPFPGTDEDWLESLRSLEGASGGAHVPPPVPLEARLGREEPPPLREDDTRGPEAGARD
jgi:hypothetical protein